MPPRSHVPPDEIVVRTDRFVFHMGARVDPTWPARAEETRLALGQSVALLLEDEDTTTRVVAKALAVEWPGDAVDFDVVLVEAPARCESQLPRRLEVQAEGADAPRFFACVLEHAFARLDASSSLASALGRAQAPEGAYGCVVAYAVAAVLVASAKESGDAKTARRLEAPLGEACSAAELAFLGGAWVKRVTDEESAAAFGERMGRLAR